MPDGIMPWLYETFAGVKETDYEAHQKYKSQGGTLSLRAWTKQGKPAPLAAQPSARALELTKGLDYNQWLAQRQADAVDIVPPKEEDEEGGATGYSTHALAFKSLPNNNWEVYKNEFGRFDVRRKQAPAPLPTGLTPAQKAEQAFRETEAQRVAEEARLTAQYREQQQQQALDVTGMEAAYRQQQLGQAQTQFQAQFGLQQQQQQQAQAQFQQQLEFQQAQAQAAQEEQERQYMSQLAAQPINWLQYASYTGQPPVVQPWMKPLGFQETEGALPAGVGVGQPIPGFQGQAGQQGMQTFANLPQLRTPSAQLQARWGPTAQAQYLGYRQARTGATPEESQFRLGSGRAPTGAHRGFSSFR